VAASRLDATNVIGLDGRYARPVCGDEGSDADREVDLTDDGPLLPEQTRDDTAAGWGEIDEANDDRLRDDRPPHWDGDW
jgi:hypothetical protein